MNNFDVWLAKVKRFKDVKTAEEAQQILVEGGNCVDFCPANNYCHGYESRDCGIAFGLWAVTEHKGV